MRLQKIKLAGFKSFVDPTTVEFPSQIIGVVGPNGCGKSNIIDAVRWVMGESSAKNLRGESITDVIFNGTVERKPIDQASIELIFDNSEGKLGGEYAQYSEIAIKRVVNRDAQSTYFLNNTKCRRRDIVDVFLGTGLSPRSYSIIEQGMISRLIEAKPEDLRVHLEEVSGISKYKERRRETETRIRHTKENLDRLNDLREEIEKQLEKLKRQASAAERYKVLKAEERQLKGQELALRWKEYDASIVDIRAQLQTLETQLQALLADQQHIETALTKNREAHHEFLDKHNEVQSRYYSFGAEVSKIEQSIQHTKERQQQLTMDLEQAEEAWRSVREHFEQDQQMLNALKSAQETLLPEKTLRQEQVEEAAAQLTVAEERSHDWQMDWDAFNERASVSAQTAQVQQTRIQHIESGQSATQQRLEKLRVERDQLNTNAAEKELAALQTELIEHTEKGVATEQQLARQLDALRAQRESYDQLTEKLDEFRGELQTAKGRLASLDALQQEALGKKNQEVGEWLTQHHLTSAMRLAEKLQVKEGWEGAVEQVLAGYLEAVCIDNPQSLTPSLEQLEGCELTLFMPDRVAASVASSSYSSLAEKVSGSPAVCNLLSTVYTAETFEAALRLADTLNSNESVVCPNGYWVGKTWIKVAKHADIKAGVILREQEIKTTHATITTLQQQVAHCEQALEQCQTALTELEVARDTLQGELTAQRTLLADCKAKISVGQAKIEQTQRRAHQIDDEMVKLQDQSRQAQRELEGARTTWQEAMVSMETEANERETLLTRRDTYREQLEEARQTARQAREALHDVEIQLRTTQSQIAGLEQSVTRMASQRESLEIRCEQLKNTLQEGHAPIEALQQELAVALEKRASVEHELTTAKQALNTCEHETRTFETERHAIEQKIQSQRQELENKRMQTQESKVRCDTLLEQLKELEFELQTVLNEIPEEVERAGITAQLESTTNRISRLGPINLAAIDELAVESERKQYLDAQYADVTEALETLEEAIRKIDKETRDRFKATYDQVNQQFQEYFPRVFGGGSARLELTGDDLLTTGVEVIARPPGKKNSTIHLLSGGEKALTAISLVFSIFQLNPAPFCMLDEVDAPLDDANVGRYCNLVKEISEKVQIIFISHNKVAIEMGQHLIGVTMNEPGVSRIVSVDVEAAVALAEV